MKRELEQILGEIIESGRGRPALSADAIRSVQDRMGIQLPPALLTLYRETDGLEQGGGAGVEVEPLGEALSLTQERPEFPNRAILLGSDCGLYEVVYDPQGEFGHGEGAVLWRDCQAPIDHAGATHLCAPSLEGFLERYLDNSLEVPR